MESMEPSRVPQENKSRSIDDAIAEIRAVEQMIRASGAVDTEPEDLKRLMTDVQSGKLDPSEAVRQAQAINDGRQNYH